MRPVLRRSVALLLTAITLCSSVPTITYEELERQVAEQPPPPEQYRKPRVVVVRFQNSAEMKSFTILPDGDYSGLVINRSKIEGAPAPPPAITPTDPAGAEKPEQPAAESIDAGQVLRETLETELFQSNRFEVVSFFEFQNAMRAEEAAGADPALAALNAARKLGADYVLLGDLTNFEIRNERSYWKVPLWAIILVGSFFIRNDDLRNMVWHAMLRAAIYVPLSSPIWGYGVEWENLELIVDLDVDFRAVNPRTGAIEFTESLGIDRKDRVRNLNLMIWASDNSVRITRSNAGRQMRFATRELSLRLARFAEQAQGFDSGL